MRTRRRFGAAAVALLVVGLVLGGASRGAADTIVVPNANATTNGATIIGGPMQDVAITYQWVFPASQFAGLPVGSQITDIGFRLPGGAGTSPASPLVYPEYDIQLSRPANPFPTLNSTFAANLGPDATLVRSGPLTVPAGAFQGGVGPNPFFDIEFTTPYTYKGGDLLVTLSHVDATSGFGFGFANDAGSVTDGLSNTNLNNSFNATSGETNFFNYPITQFSFTPPAVLEPSTLALFALGIAGLAGWRRWRWRATA
jgi:hypothetical protein